MRIEEKTLILPTLYIIKRDGATSTSDLIEELTAVFNPTGEDAKILDGRHDTKFSQKVRNLKSHRATNSMDIYTSLDSKGRYLLTDAGEEYLRENLEAICYLFSNKFTCEDFTTAIESIEKSVGKKHSLLVYSEDEMISEGTSVIKKSKTRLRSQRLRNVAIEHYKSKDGKIRCTICGFCFEEKYGDVGKDYIEIHHESPICQYSDDGFESYISEAIKNVKPLCANCHRMIHHNSIRPMTIEELKKTIK